jgi:hypothetical protein
MNKVRNRFCCWGALLALALATIALPTRAQAQDDDPPTRVARIGYMDGSVSFQPAGETDWVGAVPNRPMTTGDRLWTDQGSRAELQLGTAVIRLSENTGISFLDLDDNTVQLQLSSGSVSITVRRLNDNDDFEVDTPNLAYTILQRGHFRIDASGDGNSTTISVREGDGQATGNGQSYDVHAGQIGYFSGVESLYADVEQVGGPDTFDAWCEGRDHRYDFSRSMHYLSPDVVGFEDLDDYGDWRADPNYGNIWFPNRIDAGWAPYHTGHWAWIDPWGYTWVDDSPWGYAPFHYGRWLNVGGRWGWIAGPATIAPVYAPALVVFIGGGGGGGGWGGNVGWFPLGPREVYVPSYHVSRAYMTQINVSSTTVNTTVITNVYNTTIINNSTTITNVTYANRSVQGAVMAVPQGAFASAQPVARVAVAVNAQQIAGASIGVRVAVNPTPAAVLGGRASTAGHVAAPPAAVMNRAVVAKRTPPPAPPSFAQRQQAMAAHPGQPLPPKQVASMAPAAAARPAVRVAPPSKPATPTMGHPPANAAVRPGQPAPAAQPANRPPSQPTPSARPAAPAPAQPNRPTSQPSNQPANRPPTAQPNQPANRPPASQPSQPAPNRPAAAQPNNRPETNRPSEAPAAQPSRPPANQPASRPPAAEPSRPPASQPSNRPETTRPAETPARPPAAQPSRPAAQPNRPEENRPPAAQPKPAPSQPAARPATPPAQQHPPAATKPAPPKNQPQTPEEKKREEKPQGE